MEVNGVNLNFDFTSPSDLLRYQQAEEKRIARAAEIPSPTVPVDDPAFIKEYINMLDQSLRVYGDFLDEAFGDGVAVQLLGDNPSLTKIYEIMDAVEKAIEQQGKAFGKTVSKYTPNRAARRKK